jgi:hypothetical protein
MPGLANDPEYRLKLRQADQVRSDFAAIESDLQFIMAQRARLRYLPGAQSGHRLHQGRMPCAFA